MLLIVCYCLAITNPRLEQLHPFDMWTVYSCLLSTSQHWPLSPDPNISTISVNLWTLTQIDKCNGGGVVAPPGVAWLLLSPHKDECDGSGQGDHPSSGVSPPLCCQEWNQHWAATSATPHSDWCEDDDVIVLGLESCGCWLGPWRRLCNFHLCSRDDNYCH